MEVREKIYLDHAATTRPDAEVVEAMLPFLGERFGNPSALHRRGERARRVLEQARERCARLLEADPKGVVFTASATEANNLLVKGLVEERLRGRAVVTSRLEHPSVAKPLQHLACKGMPLRHVRNDARGRIDLDHLEALLRKESCGLLCLIHGSNEVGTLQDLAAVGRLLAEASPRTWFHVDAVQSAGHVPLAPRAWGVHSLAVSFHKIHGPPGAGLLALYRRASLIPLLHGGGQEGGLRSGTENLPGAVGGAAALEKAMRLLSEAGPRMDRLRRRLAGAIRARIPGHRLNGDPDQCLPHILSVSFEGVHGEVLLHHLEEQGILVSTGSACHARQSGVSETLIALGLPERLARGTIRISLSRDTTEGEVDRTAEALEGSVRRLREVGAP